MCVAFIPFSASLLGEYALTSTALTVYGLNLIVVGLALFTHWRYASRGGRLVDGELDPVFLRMVDRRILLAPACYLLAIGVAYLSPPISLAIYVVVPLLYLLPARFDRQFLVRR